MEVGRKGKRILLVKLILGRVIINASQLGHDESSKHLFCKNLDVL